MTYNEMIAYLRRVLSDEQGTAFESETLEDPSGEKELAFYLDRAVHEYSEQQADADNIKYVKRMSIVDGGTLPKDFIKFCGNVPVDIEGGTIRYYGEAETIGQIGGNPVKYFARLPLVSEYSGDSDLPYNNQQCIQIIEIARIYAMNKQEYNVKQDVMLVTHGGLSNGNTNQQARQR